MDYSKFTMAQLRKEYHLVITAQSGLFAAVPPVAVSDFLHQALDRNTDTALRSGSEKARSEYLILFASKSGRAEGVKLTERLV